MTPEEIFVLAGAIEEAAPPELKPLCDRLLAAIAAWIDDLDMADEDTEE